MQDVGLENQIGLNIVHGHTKYGFKGPCGASQPTL